MTDKLEEIIIKQVDLASKGGNRAACWQEIIKAVEEEYEKEWTDEEYHGIDLKKLRKQEYEHNKRYEELEELDTKISNCAKPGIDFDIVEALRLIHKILTNK